MSTFQTRLTQLKADHDALINKPNVAQPDTSGLLTRYANPVVTADHAPLEWRFDFNPETNPHLLERLPINAAFNAGAMEWNGNIIVAVRVEGNDRKSFFAIAESANGIDHFKFWDEPILMPETDLPDTNVYDMRLTRHQDGWIYGLFCTERKDPAAPAGDTSTAIADCGIARTKDLKTWERLPDLKSPSPQQRNVVLHPEYIDGKYALYTRPQDGFIDAGSGGGIGYALCDDMCNAVTTDEPVMESRIYHTIKEVKNGQGPAPLKSDIGWIHIAHGVRGTASGLRYVLYAFVSDLQDPSKVTHRPGGALMVPIGEERLGDLISILFCNGAVLRDNGDVHIYYASADTRLHVATTTIDKLTDYCINTPEDALRSHACVQQRLNLIKNNNAL